MYNNNYQSKTNKVGATQEKTTAQNSANQSEKLFGTFTETEVRNIIENSGQNFYRPNYVINYLKRAEYILDKARMSQDSKDFIKCAFQMMAGFGQWNTKAKYEFNFQMYDPYDIREMLEDGDENGAVDALNLEIGSILSDLKDEQFWFDDYEVKEAKTALNDFASLIQEYKLQDLFDTWVFTQIDNVLAK